MDAEVCPSLQTAVRNYFMMLEVRDRGVVGGWVLVLGIGGC